MNRHSASQSHSNKDELPGNRRQLKVTARRQKRRQPQTVKKTGYQLEWQTENETMPDSTRGRKEKGVHSM